MGTPSFQLPAAQHIVATAARASPRRESADAYRDQELSRLFNECGWTQERIARQMGRRQSWVSQRLCFGRFLSFIATCDNAVEVKGLTEGRFRNLWRKTSGDDRSRFAEVSSLLQTESLPVGYRNLVAKPGYAAALRELLADGRPPPTKKGRCNWCSALRDRR